MHEDKPLKEIPKLLKNTLTEQNFEICSLCHNLLGFDEPYFIEKSFVRNKKFNTLETTYEIAICSNCAQNIRKSMSAESEKAIQGFLNDLTNAQEDAQLSIDVCAFTGQKQEELVDFKAVAACQGDFLIPGFDPYIISDSVQDEMQNVLSKKTKDDIGGIMDDLIDIPPELKELFPDKPIFIF